MQPFDFRPGFERNNRTLHLLCESDLRHRAALARKRDDRIGAGHDNSIARLAHPGRDCKFDVLVGGGAVVAGQNSNRMAGLTARARGGRFHHAGSSAIDEHGSAPSYLASDFKGEPADGPGSVAGADNGDRPRPLHRQHPSRSGNSARSPIVISGAEIPSGKGCWCLLIQATGMPARFAPTTSSWAVSPTNSTCWGGRWRVRRTRLNKAVCGLRSRNSAEMTTISNKSRRPVSATISHPVE